MKIMKYASILLAALTVAAGHAQQSESPSSKGSTAISGQSAAQQAIEAAKLQIAANPNKVTPLNNLAVAYLRRARETDDQSYLQQAQQTVAHALKLDPKDFQIQKTEVALLLAQHHFPEAKAKAIALNHRNPDDVMSYGYMTEADIALGDYDDAEKSAQWMMNMLPNNIPGLILGAKLRVVYGDFDGALDFLKLAYTETSPTEIEDLAWIANLMAEVQLDEGMLDAAAALLQDTNKSLPNYTYTLQNLGRVRLEQHRPQEAIRLLTEARQSHNNPSLLYDVAVAESAAGDATAAAKDCAAFETLVAHAGDLFDDSQRDLILLYAAHPETAPQALTLAQRQISIRHDVFTTDAYAWALYANGKFAEADTQQQKVISVGIQNAQIFDHAGRIAQKLDHKEEAGKYFELAIKTDASSQYASDAREAMGRSVVATAHVPLDNVKSPGTDSPSEVSSKEPPKKQVAPASMPMLAGVTSIVAFAPVPASLLTPRPTDTDRLIRNAQLAIARNPGSAAGYSTLGAAHFQRARETGDVSDYQLAEESLTKSLDIVSNDFTADEPLGTMAEVCMGEHRFTDALTYAQKALSLGSGDVSSFAIVGDAYADMGDYDKAAQAYARLTPRDMTLSPRAAYARDSRISYLKFIAGDTPAAIALMKLSVAEGIEAQLPSENLAWLYYELGEYYVQAGDAASADIAYVTALTIHPGGYRALASLGKLRANNGKLDEAVEFYKRAIAIVPMPTFIAELGDIYAKSGNQAAAKKQYELVEYIGLLGHINQVLHNRDLAVFYADHDIKVAEAVQLARKELEVRRDVYTWDALAWALYKDGKTEEAANASHKALQSGTKDALLLFHAGMIAERQGKHPQAREYLTDALRINPQFHLVYTTEARRQVAILGSQLASGGGHAR